jgi:hypothetical protein
MRWPEWGKRGKREGGLTHPSGRLEDGQGPLHVVSLEERQEHPANSTAEQHNPDSRVILHDHGCRPNSDASKTGVPEERSVGNTERQAVAEETSLFCTNVHVGENAYGSARFRLTQVP